MILFAPVESKNSLVKTELLLFLFSPNKGSLFISFELRLHLLLKSLTPIIAKVNRKRPAEDSWNYRDSV